VYSTGARHTANFHPNGEWVRRILKPLPLEFLKKMLDSTSRGIRNSASKPGDILRHFAVRKYQGGERGRWLGVASTVYSGTSLRALKADVEDLYYTVERLDKGRRDPMFRRVEKVRTAILARVR
jgi:hypothetical protein